jgi:hypothetical protein
MIDVWSQEIMRRLVQAGTRDGDRRELVSQQPDVPAGCGGRTPVLSPQVAAPESQDRGSHAGVPDCNEGSTRPGSSAAAVHGAG